MSAGVLLQALLTGLAAGAVYGLVALGVSLVAGLTRVVPLAQGDVTVGAALGAAVAVLGPTPVVLAPGPLPSVLVVGGALALGAVGSTGVWLVARRAVRAGDAVAWVAAMLTGGLLLRELLAAALPSAAYAVPDPLHLDGLTGGSLSLPGGAVLPGRVPAVLLLGLVLGTTAQRLLGAGRVGRGLRALADDPDAAALCGVPARRLALLGYAAAGLLAAGAGLLDAPAHPVTVTAGVLLGLKGTAAAVVGGLGSLQGALLAGVALGVVEQVAVAAPGPGPAWQDLLLPLVLVVAVAVRPGPLAGDASGAL